VRITQVRFKNLNSLAGDWTIDFTHPAYVGDGLFAITGPTGAGKTTILDAICLALYGRTPRLDRVNKTANDIMSRHCHTCFAEVTFESEAGRFICHWSQRRARQRADGELQQPKHEISDATTGQLLEGQTRKVATRIVDATGMDFHQFTRAVLLAQGGFAAFLNASVDERSALLERLTGEHLYSEISMAVHERRRIERHTLEALTEKMDNFVILTPDALAVLETQRSRDEAALTDCKEALETLRQHIAVKNKVLGLQAELTAIAEQLIQVDAEYVAFEPERVRLARANAALALEGTYAGLDATRQEQSVDQDAYQRWCSEEPQLAREVDEGRAELSRAIAHTVAKKDAYERLKPQWVQMRDADQQIVTHRDALASLQARCEQLLADAESRQAALANAQQAKETERQALESVQAYLTEHVRDHWLLEHLTGLEALASEWTRARDARENQRLLLEEAEALLAQKSQSRAQAQAKREQGCLDLVEADHQLVAKQGELGGVLGDRLLREYHAHKDALMRERMLLHRVLELEEQRQTLQDGLPCPLCGATEHPFALGQLPVPDALDADIAKVDATIQAAQTLTDDLHALETRQTDLRLIVAGLENREAVIAAEEQNTRQVVETLREALDKNQGDAESRQQALLAQLANVGVTEVPATAIASLLDHLRERRDVWLKRQDEQQVLLLRIGQVDATIQRECALLEVCEQQLAQQRADIAKAHERLAVSVQERAQQFGARDPVHEEQAASAAVVVAEDAERQCREQQQARETGLVAFQVKLADCQARIAARAGVLQAAESAFQTQLLQIGLANEAAYQAARLTPAVRADLGERAKALDDLRAGLMQRQGDRQAQLHAAERQLPAEVTLEALEADKVVQEETHDELQRALADVRQRLNAHAAVQSQRLAQLALIEAQRQTFQRWQALHDLIGSEDGKKFRNFAQGLTFDVMVRHANRQLRQMSDRYVLIRDMEQPLELNVVDTYQAGEIRSTKNLSGGESFLVSLALALGLSQMASQKVRVESLFLDEGFGTLDPDALDTALATLGSLQQSGKLIGVISHVTSLKERITTQITVIPQTGGRSKLSGPGCSNVSHRS